MTALLINDIGKEMFYINCRALSFSFSRLVQRFAKSKEILNCDIFFDPKKKCAMVVDNDIYREITFLCNRQPKRLRGTIASTPTVLLYSRYGIIAKYVNDLINRLIEGGVPQQWNRYYAWHKYVLGSEFDKKKGPQVFSLENVSYGFNVWMIACSVSILGFLAECIQVIDNFIFLI
jgi:hypothetical protein